ncbi:hypothetical protein J4446_00830 [Candidatus Woesearchaeota archaeon]|nr:hypothetical protein [Candidatus Woesearchaeota archaeon]
MKRLSYLFIFLIVCFSVYAADINILTYRDDYNPLETFQAEVILDSEPASELTNLNFEFSKDSQIGILLFLEKISDKHYFVYFNIPDVNKGEYKFKVKNINVIENGILKRISAEKTVNVLEANSGFEYLLNHQNIDGSFGNVMETSLSSLALKNIDYEKAILGVNYLLNNQDPTGCYPKNNCNVRDTSFALLALSKFNQNYIKTKNWLKDAGNNFDLGLWNLKLEGNAVCGNIQLNGVYNLNIEDKETNITCNNAVDFTLTHNYLGNTHTIHQYSGNNFYYSIEDSGCYGSTYKSSCDYINSLYASWALDSINEDFPQQYLENNKLDNRTIDHSIGYILNNDNEDKDWLLNNYLNGYWSYSSASLSQTPDYFVSALSAYALRNEFLFEEAKNYLESRTQTSILNSGLILYLLFDDEMNLPSVSITPGISNKLRSFNLKIKNNKEPLNIFIEAPNSSRLPSEIYLQNEANYNVNIIESFDILINYGNFSYTIPVIAQNEEASESPLLPPPKDAIQFINEDVEIYLNIDESPSDELELINMWDFKINDITINVTGNLRDILEIEQDYFDSIESGKTLRTSIILNKDKKPVYPIYEGYVIIKSSKNIFDSIKFSVNFEVGDYKQEESIDNNEETVTSDEEQSTTSEKTSSEKKRNLWWLWTIIILIIGVLIFIFFRKRKEVTQSFDDYAKKIKK